jgi:Putative prokaryotic signal transducing protein
VAAVTLTVVSSDLEAEMLCGELRANGIECRYEKTGPGAALGAYAISNAGPTAVLVNETQFAEARRFLPDAR